MPHIRLTSVLSIIVMATALSACRSLPAPDYPLIPAVAAETPTVTPTPEALVGDTDGSGSVSEYEKEILAKNAVRDYAMPDGSVVQVDPTQPLPAEVVAAISGLARPLVDRLVDPREGSQEASAELRAFGDDQAAATGRAIVIFHHVWSADPEWGPDQLWWYGDFSGEPIPVLASPDHDQNLADVAAAAAKWNAELIVVE